MVEAVKRTANDLGGMQNVREILVQSDDPKRLNVYAHYAGTLFPDFKAEKVGSWIEMKNKKYNPEDKQLREIGETTAKPYLLTKLDESVYYVTWGFKTDSGTEYKIVIGKNFRGEDPESEEERDENELEFLVSFGVVSQGTVDFEAEFKDVKNLFRVMATVIKAVKISIEDEEDESGIPVTKIVIEPTKREINTPGSAGPVYDKSDTRRADLYMRFIQKQMPPGAKVRSTADKGRIEILLPTE